MYAAKQMPWAPLSRCLVWLAVVGGGVSCVPNVSKHDYEPRITIRFDPAQSIIPTPNDLVLSDPLRQQADLHLNVPIPITRSGLRRLCEEVAKASWDQEQNLCVSSAEYRQTHCLPTGPCPVALDYRQVICDGDQAEFCPPCQDADCSSQSDLDLHESQGCSLDPAGRSSMAHCAFVKDYLDRLNGWPVFSTVVATFSDERPADDLAALRVDRETVSHDSVLLYDVTDLAKGTVTLVPDTTVRLVDAYVRTEGRASGSPRIIVRSQLEVLRSTPFPAGRTFAVIVLGGNADADCQDVSCVRLTNGQPVIASYWFSLVKSRDPLTRTVASFEDDQAQGSWVVATADEAVQLEAVRAGYDAILQGLDSSILSAEYRVRRDNVILMSTFTTHAAATVQFDPAAASIPTPNDMLLGTDGTLNFPVAESDSQAQKDLFAFLNEQDGFSVLSTIEIGFTESVDPTTLGPESVLVVDVTAEPPKILSDILLVPDGNPVRHLTLMRATPFEHGRHYLVLLTNAIHGLLQCEAGVQDCPEAPGLVRPPAVQLLLSTSPLATLLTDPLEQIGHTACTHDSQFWATNLPGLLAECDAAQFEAFRQGMQTLVPLLADVDVDLRNVATLFSFAIGTAPESLIDPNRNLVPLPNDLLYFGPLSQQPTGSCSDQVPQCSAGHLCAPIHCDQDPAAAQSFFSWLNRQDGWSAVISGGTLFSQDLDPATLPEAVRLLEITEDGLEPVNDALVLYDSVSREVSITKTGHFLRQGRYAVVVTNGLRSAQGSPFAPATFTVLMRGASPLADAQGHSTLPLLLDDTKAAVLESLHAGLQPLLDSLESSVTIAREDIVTLWTFTIQSSNEALYNPDPTNPILPFPNEVLQNQQLDEVTKRPLPGITLPIPAEEGLLRTMLTELAKSDGFSVMGDISTTLLENLDPAQFVLFDPNQASVANLLNLPNVTIAFGDIADVNLSSPNISAELTKIKAGTPGARVVASMVHNAASEDYLLDLMPELGEPLRQNRRFMIVMQDQLTSTVLGADGAPLPLQVSPAFLMIRMPVPLALVAVDENEGTLCPDGQSWQSQLPDQLDDCTAAQLEVLRRAYEPIFMAIDGFCDLLGCDPETFNRTRVALFWTFWTQSLTGPLERLRQFLQDEPLSANIHGTLQLGQDFSQTHNDDVLIPFCTEDQYERCMEHVDRVIYRGTFDARYLLPLDLAGQPQVGSFVTGDDGTILTERAATVPLSFSLYVPVENEARGIVRPFPVVVFQHGLHGQAEQVFSNSLLDRLCAAGFAVAAIDLPYHGTRTLPGQESGTGFLSGDPFAVRDNLRQAALDQMQLLALIKNETDGLHAYVKDAWPTANPVLDTSHVYFAGVSLGAMAGTSLLSVEPGFERAVFTSAGGHLTRVLTGLPTGTDGDGQPYLPEEVKTDAADISGVLDELLVSLGILDCTTDPCAVLDPAAYRLFLQNVQWILDPADPVALAPYVRREPVTSKDFATPVLLQVAGSDELFKRPVSDELCRALQGPAAGGHDPCDPQDARAVRTLRVYPDACHGFLCDRDACGLPQTVPTQQRQAIDDLLCFLHCGTAATVGFVDEIDGGCQLLDEIPFCLTPEQCTDGVDNDGDNTVDCADADCLGNPHCP